MPDPGPVLRGRGRELALATPVLLAPLEGVTDPAFLDAVLPLGGLGAACVPFLRISGSAFGPAVLRRRWDHAAAPVPVGLQLLAQDTVGLAETAANAADLGVPFLDLNFGCPSPTVLRSGGGAALLEAPETIEALTACVVGAVELPVGVKLRAGGEDDSRLEELLDAAAKGGAGFVTLHARLRGEGYDIPPDWDRIGRAQASLAARHPGVVLVGNGGVVTPADAESLRAGTGCAAVMVATGMMADPWLAARIAGRPGPAGAADVLVWLRAYAADLRAFAGARVALGRLKQLLGVLAVPEWPVEEARRRAWLRCGSLEELVGDLDLP